MRQRVLWWLISGLLLVSVELPAQESVDSTALTRQRALQELEGIIAESDTLADNLAVVKIRAKAANLLWLQDVDRGRTMFRELWRWIEAQKDKDLNKDAARTELLKNLFPRDPKMAKELLEKVSQGDRSEEAPFQAQIAGTDPNLRRLAKLSSGLSDQDTAMAAALLERSLSVSVSPPALSSLMRLREKDPSVADYVVARTLENLRMRPTVVALPGVYMLIDYVFPSKQSFGKPITKPPDPSLRMQYFLAAYDILQKSLGESEQLLLKEQRYTEKDLRFRSIYQGQVAGILSALAPRYAPELTAELTKLATNLAAGFPPEIIQLHRMTLARITGNLTDSDSPETAISIAVARGEVEKARDLLEKLEDESARKALSQAVANVEFRTHLAKSNLAEALMAARNAEDPNIRASLYAQVAKAAYRKGEVEFSRLILAEARVALSKSESNGMRARALLELAAEASIISALDSIEILRSAVLDINLLSKATSGGGSKGDLLAKMNNPQTLIDEPELQQAFSSVGAIDFDSALLTASQIEDKSIRLIAKLATCKKWLTERSEQ